MGQAPACEARVATTPRCAVAPPRTEDILILDARRTVPSDAVSLAVFLRSNHGRALDRLRATGRGGHAATCRIVVVAAPWRREPVSRRCRPDRPRSRIESFIHSAVRDADRRRAQGVAAAAATRARSCRGAEPDRVAAAPRRREPDRVAAVAPLRELDSRRRRDESWIVSAAAATRDRVAKAPRRRELDRVAPAPRREPDRVAADERSYRKGAAATRPGSCCARAGSSSGSADAVSSGCNQGRGVERRRSSTQDRRRVPLPLRGPDRGGLCLPARRHGRHREAQAPREEA